MHLPKGHTAHYRKELPAKHKNAAKNKRRLQKTLSVFGSFAVIRDLVMKKYPLQ